MEENPALASQPPPPQPHDIHILLVDDERLSRTVVANLLRKCQYKVTVVEGGSQALEALKREQPGTFQLVLTAHLAGRHAAHAAGYCFCVVNRAPQLHDMLLQDVMMPQVDGLDLLRFVRSHEQLMDLPVVMMSASEQAETVYQCIQGGAEEYLVKPVTQKEVQKIWTHVVRRLNNSAAGSTAHATGAAMIGAGATGAGTGQAGGGAAPGAVAALPLPIPMIRQHGGEAVGVGAASQQQAARARLGAGPAAVLEHPTLPAAGGARAAHVPGDVAPGAGAAGASGRGAPGPLVVRRAAGPLVVAGGMSGTGTSPAAAIAAAGAHGAGVGGTGAEVISLLAWLCRPQRASTPKESWWVFTEVLLLVESFHKHSPDSVGRLLRPSRMVLHRNGRVLFTGGAPAARPTPCCPADHPGAAPCAPCSGTPTATTAPPPPAAAAAAVAAPASAAAGSTGPAGLGGAPDASAHHAQPCANTKGTEGQGKPPMDEEDAAYASPEELAGGQTSSASDVFSLGVLFFDLFYVAPPPDSSAGRRRALRDLRQRILPATFLRGMPKEAAFALALLHPDPAARPTVSELLASDALKGAADALRARHSAQVAQEEALEAQVLVDFLRLMHSRKRTEAARVELELEALAADAAQLERHLMGLTRAAKRQRMPPARVASRVQLAVAAAAQQQQQQQQQQGPPPSPKRSEVRTGNEPSTSSAMPRASLGTTTTPGGGLGADSSEVRDVAQALAAEKWARVSPAHAAQLEDLYLSRRSLAVAAAAAAPQDAAGKGGASAVGAVADRRSSGLGATAVGTHAGTAADAAAPAGPAGNSTGSLGADVCMPSHSNSAAAGKQTGGGEAMETDTPAGGSQPSQRVHAPDSQPATSLSPGSALLNGSALMRVPADSTLPQQGAVTTTPATPRAAQQGARAAATVLPSHLTAFSDDLSHFVRHERFEVLASLRYGGANLSPSSMVCCAAFDRDDEFFATAGVSKRIRIYELAAAMGGAAALGAECAAFPILEISSRSRLSSVCWSTYVKPHLAAADYDGVVALWDANTNTEVMQLEEHTKRVWAVDFSRVDPLRLASASDDGTVRVWSVNQEASVARLDCKANVCSVQWNPEVSHLLAAGSASCRSYLYDLRYPATPLAVMQGHQKAVSYVRHVSATELVTASTDSSLRLWPLVRPGTTGGGPHGAGSSGEPDGSSVTGDGSDGSSGATVPSTAARQHARLAKPWEPPCALTYRGHANERNFVGLSVSGSGYIACGSETNTVYCYYKGLPMPAITHSFSSVSGHGTAGEPSAAAGGAGAAGAGGSGAGSGAFISTVAWARRSNTLLAANSLGHIRVLSLV